MIKLFKTKFILKIVEKINNSYVLIKTIRLKKLIDDYQGHTIDYNLPFLINSLKIYYYIEINKGQIIQNEIDDKRNIITLTDMIVNKSIIKQLSANLDKAREKLIRNWLLIGIALGTVIGGAIGYIAGIS